MSQGEFPRLVDVRQCDGRAIDLTANEQECTALAERFGLVAVHNLHATAVLTRDGEDVAAQGNLTASIVQSCAISGEDLAVEVAEAFALRFTPQADLDALEGEIELDADDCDVIPYAGTMIDLGEAVAQGLALAIDPYATGPEAEATREKAGIASESAAGPFAALAALRERKRPKD